MPVSGLFKNANTEECYFGNSYHFKGAVVLHNGAVLLLIVMPINIHTDCAIIDSNAYKYTHRQKKSCP